MTIKGFLILIYFRKMYILAKNVQTSQNLVSDYFFIQIVVKKFRLKKSLFAT